MNSGRPFVLATVVVGANNTPGRSGFKLICYDDGTFTGTVGGGKLERLVLDHCLELHKKTENSFQEYELTEEKDGIGMICGGIAKVFFEYFPVGKRICIFGAGHLCRSFVPVIKSLGFYVIVIDNRPEFADPAKIQQADEVIAAEYRKYIDAMQSGKEDAIVIFTHGHEYDYDILDQICSRNLDVKYIGMIGSAGKVKQAVDGIESSKYDGDLIRKVHAPIGLNIGKRSTQEIAVAIAAEILAVYNGVKKIRSLSEKEEQDDKN
jgi:xanthine dehydrogenase accessory factor